MPSALVCPAGHEPHGEEDRFCRECGLPLVLAGVAAPAETERRAMARKVSPQYGEGQLVKVGWARNQAEAELIAGMLLEEGIPSVVRRARGFDVPDFMAAGPRDILVAASGADAARDMLRAVEQAALHAVPRSPGPAWVRVLATVLVVVVLGLVIGGVLTALLR